MPAAIVHESEVLQNGDYTANRHFTKVVFHCVARVAIFTNGVFGGLNAPFAKLQMNFLTALKTRRKTATYLSSGRPILPGS